MLCVIKCILINGDDRSWDDDTKQRGAFIERPSSNALKALMELDLYQCSTVEKYRYAMRVSRTFKK
jgi:hypothetical protein